MPRSGGPVPVHQYGWKRPSPTFYSYRDTMVDVTVQFRQGLRHRMFPQRAAVSPRRLSWGTPSRSESREPDHLEERGRVTPGAPSRSEDRVEREPNHYYAARETDAAPLQRAPNGNGFCSTVAWADSAADRGDAWSNGQIVANHTRGEPLGDIILFENRTGATAYTALHTPRALAAAFNALEPEGEGPSPQMHLQKALVAHGLYPREAKAMVDSWRGSWFEQGTRLFYIVSGDAVDAILPLQIDPQPVEVKRVFVGRLEIATPATLREVKVALETGDRAKLAQYGRFLDPIGATCWPSERAAVAARRLSRCWCSRPGPSAQPPQVDADVGRRSTTCSAASPPR